MKYQKQFALTAAVRSVFLSLLILFPFFAKAQAQSGPLFIPIPGFNVAEESGVFDLADCLAQALGGEVLSPDKVNLNIPGIKNVVEQGYDALLEFLFSKDQEAREILQKAKESIETAALDAHNMGRKIYIVCHSWGCTLALRVVQDLADQGFHHDEIPIETMIMIDRITAGYPRRYPGNIRPDTVGIPGMKLPLVPKNAKKIFIVRQEWEPGAQGGDVAIDNPEEACVEGAEGTCVVGNFNLRGNLMNPTKEERELLKEVREEFKNKFDRKLKQINTKNELHTFLDDSSVIWKLAEKKFAEKGIDLPCECINIAGTAWLGSETGTLTCTVAGETETEPVSESGIVTIEQNGCDITTTSTPLPGIDIVRTGTIEQNNISVSGPFYYPLEGGVSITENIFTAEGTVKRKVKRRKINLKGSGLLREQ